MNRRTFLHSAALTVPLAAIPGAAAQAISDTAKVNTESARRIEKATTAAMAMQRRDWEQGILAQAMVEAGDRQRAILLTRAAMVQETPDGRLGVVVSGSPTDPSMGGCAYARAAEWTGDPQIQQAVGLLFAELQRLRK